MPRVWLIFLIGIIALGGLLYLLAVFRPEAWDSEGTKPQLVYLLILFILVGSGLIVRWHSLSALKGFKYGIIWAGLGLLLVLGYSYRAEIQPILSRTIASLMPGQAMEIKLGTVIIKAGEDGHFRLDADVNNTRVRLLLDTGASFVTLNRRDATRIGFDIDRISFSQRIQTANGIGRVAAIRLRSIKIGPIVVKNLKALVNQAPMSTSLLGINYLENLSAYTVKRDTLILTQ